MSGVNLKMYYFAMGGRTTPARTCIALAQQEKGAAFKDTINSFEFIGVPFDEWFGEKGQDRELFPLGDIPVLHVEDPATGTKTVVCESIAINAYIGQLTGFWPTSALGAARAVEIMVTFEQFFCGMVSGPDDANFISTFSMAEEQKMKARAGPCTDRLKFYMGRCEDIVGSNGYAIGDKDTIIDMFVAAMYLMISGGHAEGIEAKTVEPFVNIGKITGRILHDEKLKPIFLGLMK